ncbi:MAG TPA: hypothetical protein V6D31_08620 [Candidatus Sericytochromatia bacterium]|jgi:hypothetical protein
MAKVQQTVYLITEQQREALINYLQNRPFREVAVAIQFLTNAPNAVLNVENPDPQPSASETEQSILPAPDLRGMPDISTAQ